MQLKNTGEFGLISHLRGRLAKREGVLLGIGDDAALLSPLEAPVVTCDALLENVHFRRDWSTARQIGHKAITINVSDVAAMGGVPVAAFICLAASPDEDLAFIDELYAGMEEAAGLYGLTIAGGDTVGGEALMVAITMVGNAPIVVTRSSARVGDTLLLTGSLGEASAGLEMLRQPGLPVPAATRAHLLARHRQPSARVAEMQAAVGLPGGVTAALDISDGLAADAAHLADESNVTLEIDLAQLAISAAIRVAADRAGVDPVNWVLSGGEDYEILMAVAPDKAAAICAAVTGVTGTPLATIGRCIPRREDAVILLSPDGSRVRAPRGFTHF